MKLKINFKSLEWWYWCITLIAMITGLAGVIEGFYLVIFVSLIQFFHFMFSNGFAALQTQVRLVYAIITIIAFFDPTHIIYWILLVGTIMVTLFDKCIIAKALILMPWNKGKKLT